ncbi:MAG: hypothetical protein FIA82_09030 [Melioribacter sp.]|nr:hypothetical protein [Melioribacter sp.]
MQNQYKNTKRILLTGSILAGAIFGTGAPKAISAENLFNYNGLGSGSELRTSLLNTSPNRNLEMKCGNKSDGKDSKPNDSKTKDAKCGDKKMSDSKAKDGKCGDKKMSDAKGPKAADSKAKDGKCGEGKCGDKKKESKPADSKK